MYEEWVVGSYMSYKKNPNYWDSTTIDGVEYQMPFIERVVMPIIPDTSTQIAALRTGQLDMHHGVPIEQQESLERTTPQLMSAPFIGGVSRIVLKCNEPPFDDRNVRRAMMIGTDIRAFKRLAKMPDQQLHVYPANPYDPSIYTPLEDLSPEGQDLYDYDPEQAKKMLADAGYPNGFDIEFWTNATPSALDFASLLKDNWAKIGVNVEIKSFDDVTAHQYRTTGTYKNSISDGVPIANPLPIVENMAKTGGTWNYSQYSNARVDELALAIGQELDVDKKNEMYREAFDIILNDVLNIPTTLGLGKFYWWPWLKNYHGEFAIDDDSGFFAVLPYIWIDQEMKAEMGF
jgi:peptide/nickel transport system substrate-binding protein